MSNELMIPGQQLVPESMSQAIQLAEMMVKSDFVPKHLKNPSDMLLVIEQSMRWRMSPFAVAQATSVIQGKLMFEGKLVAAAVSSSGAMDQRLNYEYGGEGAGRTVTVSGRLKGEQTPRTVEVKLNDVKTTNQMWTKQPDQQLSYAGARIWARRHLPEVILGVYSPGEDMDDAPQMQTVHVQESAPNQSLKDTLKARISAPEKELEPEIHVADLGEIVSDLEDAAAVSTAELKKQWEALTPDQRKRLGRAEQERLKQLAETCAAANAGRDNVLVANAP